MIDGWGLTHTCRAWIDGGLSVRWLFAPFESILFLRSLTCRAAKQNPSPVQILTVQTSVASSVPLQTFQRDEGCQTVLGWAFFFAAQRVFNFWKYGAMKWLGAVWDSFSEVAHGQEDPAWIWRCCPLEDPLSALQFKSCFLMSLLCRTKVLMSHGLV